MNALSKVTKRTTALLAGVALAAIATPAAAQVAAPAVRQSVDANGVDLITGIYNASTTEISIGPADGGLSFTRYWTGSGWRDSGVATITGSTGAPVVSISGVSESFVLSGGAYTSTENSGATLVKDGGGNYTYTAADGTIVRFQPPNSTRYNRFESNLGWVTTITEPNGTVRTFAYASASYRECLEPTPGAPTVQCPQASATRLKSIASSTGYELQFRYESDALDADNPDVGAYTNMVGVSTINRAVNIGQALSSISYGGTYGGRVTSVTDAAQRTTTYGYNSAGRLASVRRPGSSVDDVAIAYDADGRVSSITRDGQTWRYSFTVDSANSVMTAKVFDPLNHERTVYSDTRNFRVGLEVNENGYGTNYVYDDPLGKARLDTVTYPEGNQMILGYDGRGNVTSTTQRARSGSGLTDLVSSAVFPDTCPNQKTCNKPESTTDVTGQVTTYEYEPESGMVTKVTAPAAPNGVSPQTRYSYVWGAPWLKDALGNVVLQGATIRVLDTVSVCRASASCAGGPDETKTRVAYTAPTGGQGSNLLPASVTVQAGNGGPAVTSTVGYDEIRNVTSATHPNSNSSRIAYNAARQVTASWGPDPDGAGPQRPRAVITHYMADGNPDSVSAGTVNVDGSGFSALQHTLIAYDAYGRKSSERLNPGSDTAPTAAFSLTQYGYDALGRVECMAQRMVPSTYGGLPEACEQTANAPDRISKTVYEYAGAVDSVYSGVGTGLERRDIGYLRNRNGQVTRVTDGKGNTTGYQYDGHDRLLRTCYNATEVNCGSDFVQLTYGTSGTGNGRVVARSLRGHATTIVTGYAYDNLGRVTRVDYPGSGFTDRDVSLTYDLLGRIISAADDGTHSATFDYDALGRVTRQGDSISSRTMEYDLAGRRKKLTWQDGFNVTYEYDATGAVTAIREDGGPVLASFGYDDLGRRVSLTRGNGVKTTYAYDGGSRLAEQDLYFPNVANNQFVDFEYNAAGQITKRTASNDAYAWTRHYDVSRPYETNPLNQYSKIGGGAAQLTPSYDVKGNLASAGGASFGYNTKNELSSTSEGGKQFYHDPLGRLDSVLDAAGDGLTGFQYDGGEIVTELDTRPGSGFPVLRRYVRGPGTDEPLVWYEGSGTGDKRYLVADERGSVVAVTDASGGSVAINSYDEYGVPASTNLGRFQYTGQAWLSELGMYSYKARIYSPTHGRFMQTDPIGFVDGINWYNYVGGDPVNNTDPSGLDTRDQCLRDQAASVGGNVVVCGGGKSHPNGNADEGRRFGFDIPATPTFAPPPAHSLLSLGSSAAPQSGESTVCRGRALVYAGNPRHVGRTGGMLRPIRPGAAAIIPRQWTGTRTAGPVLRAGGASVTGRTGGGQQFRGLDDTAGNLDLGPDPQAVLMDRAEGSLYVELVTGRHEGQTSVTVNIPSGSGLSCPQGTTPVGK